MAKKVQKVLSSFAVFDPAEEGGYNISFPDFPGCVTFGGTFEEAKKKAGEVLSLWIEELSSQKQKIPYQTSRPILEKHGKQYYRSRSSSRQIKTYSHQNSDGNYQAIKDSERKIQIGLIIFKELGEAYCYASSH